MRITDVRTMRLRGPDPHGIGGQAREYSFLFVRIDTDAGIHGIGEALAFPGVREAIEVGRDWLIGRDPLAIGPAVRGLLYGALPVPGDPVAPLMSSTATVAGPPAWAAAGIDTALWDLAGKALGAPVHQLLGGAYRDAVRVYLDRSGVADPTDLGAWAGLGERAVAEGFDWLKLDLEQIAPDLTADGWSRQIGSAQLDAIVSRVAAVRDAVGPAVDIGIDGHFCFDVESAARVATALAPLRPRWLEDPVPITSAASLARVRSGSAIPIAAGETFIAEQFRLFIEAGALDIAHPDILFAGGLGEGSRIATLADLWYLPLAFHDNGSGVATIATAHLAGTIAGNLGMEYHFYDAAWVGAVARRDVPLFVDGAVPLTDAPGLGLELDPEICERYVVPGDAVSSEAADADGETLRVGLAFPYREDRLEELRAISPRLAIRHVDAFDLAAIDGIADPSLDALIAQQLPSRVDSVPRLRWLQVLSAGVDHVIARGDLPEHVMLTNARGAYAGAMAQFALTAILRAAAPIERRRQAQEARAWPGDWEELETFFSTRLRERLAVIVGYGGIGREVGRLADAFGMRVIAAKARPDVPADDVFHLDGTGDPEGRIPERFVGIDGLPDAVREADYLIITLPLTPHSGGAVSEAVIAALPPHAYVVNIGRGGVMDEQALIAALSEGRIAGAALDVFETEPLPADHPLWTLPNVTITPHIAGAGAAIEIHQLLLENLGRFVTGTPLRNEVDRARGY